MRRMPTSVVTGGAGFLGSHLCEHLLAEGHRVICVDNLDTGSLTNIEHIRDDAFTFLNQDVTSHIELGEDVDFIFHFASPASPIDYLRLPLHTLKVGAYGTHNALGLAKFKRARFVLASTSEVYGDPLLHPQPESYWGNVNPIGPRGVYDEAKRYAEALTMAYHRQQGVDTAIVRIFNTYGPRMRAFDGRAIPTFLRQALLGQPLTVFGDGSQTRSFCYVEDLDRRHLAARDLWRARARQHRQSGGVHAPPARRAGDRRHRLREPDRVRVAARERSGAAAARHHPRQKSARLGTGNLARGGPSAGPRAVGPARADRKDYLSMHRRYMAALAVAAISCAVLPAAASAKLKLGVTSIAIQNRSPTLFYDNVNALKMNVIRSQINWANIAAKKPHAPEDPNDPAYDWRALDKLVKESAAWQAAAPTAGRTAIYDIWGTPKWARLYTGHVAFVPVPKTAYFRYFVRAVAKRYNGTFVPAGSPAGTKPLPRITHWEIWNEPNNALGLAKPSKAKGKKNGVPAGAKAYVTLLNTAYSAIHARTRSASRRPRHRRRRRRPHGHRPRHVLHGELRA